MYRPGGAGRFDAGADGSGTRQHGDPFRIVHADSVLRHGVYYMNASMALSLGNEAVDALNNGVPLVLDVHIGITSRRAFLWDPTIATLTQSYRLTYHVLSQRYVLQNLNSGRRRVYRRWRAALHDVSRIRSLPVIDAGLLEPHEHYDIHVSVQLNVKIIPTGFGLLTQMFYDADRSSDAYSWELQ